MTSEMSTNINTEKSSTLEIKNGIEIAKEWTKAIFKAAQLSKGFEIINLCQKIENMELLTENLSNEPKIKIEGSPPKNHSFRFSMEDSYSSTKKTSWGFKPSRKSIFGSSISETQEYEDV